MYGGLCTKRVRTGANTLKSYGNREIPFIFGERLSDRGICNTVL